MNGDTFPEELDCFLTELENGEGELATDLAVYEVVVKGEEFPFYGIDYPLGKLLLPAEVATRIQEVRVVPTTSLSPVRVVEVEIVPPCIEWVIFCISFINEASKDLAFGVAPGGQTLVIRNHGANKDKDTQVVAKVLACEYDKDISYFLEKKNDN